ncbi:hypothetical protein [Pseudobdellovibrio exovorus]|uniref:Peptidase C1A papain C-terminal domain-containing protein n=1 Tax=Pseudobdellovibrio exovorus JSS TaxID=1184267 RepID=M4VBQ1_9BACT|nr:hypothetical protein [Pseudobdellovibrio exovorus]AGH96653.1 hypothetical protein A11Q_2437 [Pseudobdellovibrio exovorus JSS]
MKLSKSLVSILFSTFAFSSAWAMTTVRLDAAGGSMQFMPVMDQQKSATCYAYTATQMYDSYRFGREHDSRTQVLSSPQALAIEYTLNGAEDLDWNGGYPDPTLTYAIVNGTCSYQDFNGDLNGNSIDQFMQSLESELNGLNPNGPGAGFDSNSPFTRHDDPRAEALRNIAIHRAYQRQRLMEKAQERVTERCQERITLSAAPQMTKVDLDGATRLDKLKSSVQTTLQNKHAAAIGMVYCEDFLRGNGDRVVDQNGLFQRLECKEYHASVLVGWRGNNNQVEEVLLRNTRGTSCDKYGDKWKTRCEAGQLWIPAEDLALNAQYLLLLQGRD